jgi:hemolysin III
MGASMPSVVQSNSGSWSYDHGEFLADRVVHATGLALGGTGALVIVLIAANGLGPVGIVSPAIYAACLLSMLGLSAAYNLCPVSRTKWILRRFDHAAIYAMIAGTYTPFLAQMRADVATNLLIVIWTSAFAGVVLKLIFVNRFEGVAIAVYLVLGWSGLLIYQTVAANVPELSLVLLGIGGVLYSGGLVFYGWGSLRFQNAIWHCFVLAAAACHYFAIVYFIAATRL